MRISIARIIGLLNIIFGLIILSFLLWYLYSPEKNSSGDVFLEDLLWFVPAYLLLGVGLLSLYGSKLSLRIAAWSAFLLITPSILLTLVYLNRSGELIILGAIIYGIPLFLISGICAFFLNRESNRIVEGEGFREKSTLVLMISTMVLALLLSILPIKRVVADKAFRQKTETLKTKTSISNWNDTLVSEENSAGCTQLQLAKKIQVHFDIVVPDGEQQFILDVLRSQRGTGVSQAFSGKEMTDNFQEMIFKKKGIDKSLVSGTHAFTLEISPCLFESDTTAISYLINVELHPLGAKYLGTNDLLYNSNLGQDFVTKKYSVEELR